MCVPDNQKTENHTIEQPCSNQVFAIHEQCPAFVVSSSVNLEVELRWPLLVWVGLEVVKKLDSRQKMNYNRRFEYKPINLLAFDDFYGDDQ